MIHTASSKQIREGLVTDVYFERTEKVLKAKGIDKEVRAEFMAKSLPREWSWAIFSGLEECTSLLENMPLDLRAMKEGTVFHPFEPVMEVRGKYLDFGRYETTILGFICQASAIATMAARCRIAAGKRPVISFGARRMHPAIAPMTERNAYIGGCDGVAVSLGAELAGIQPTGTMPHSLILLMGDTLEAARAFNEVIEPEVRRVCLIDTFNDEKPEALNVAGALGKDLFAIRFDTPASRRGNLLKIMEEVRWELDLKGLNDVRFFLSGGLDEYQILKYNSIVDAYGVGTSISSAPVIDFSMDIVEIDGEPVAKRGKRSGSKKVLRCRECLEAEVIPAAGEPGRCCCGATMEEILLPHISGGRVKDELPTATGIRNYVLEQLKKVALDGSTM